MSIEIPIMTRVTQLLQCKTPIVSPPMAGASGGALAAHVSLAGGFGFLASGYEGLERFQKELDLAESILGTPKDQILPIGVGFLGWQLDDSTHPARKALSASLARGVKAVWLSFGNNLGEWVKFIRNWERTDRPVVVILVSNADEASIAALEWKADILVAQGIEAGGHGSASAPPLLSLIPSILSAISDSPPILAAGGLANGAHLASMIALGASGAVYGTRFLLSDESLYSADQKSALRDAKDMSATIRTMAFDEARGTLEWPNGIDGRALLNATVTDVDKFSLEERKQMFNEGTLRGDKNRILVWAGTGTSLINDSKPAQTILQTLHVEAIERLTAVQRIINPV